MDGTSFPGKKIKQDEVLFISIFDILRFGSCSFLLEHSKQTVAVTPERADGKVECAIPRANGPERWITADEVRRASGEHKLLLPPHDLSLTPRARTVSQLSSQPGRHLALTPKIMATPPEAIQLYLRKAETHSHFGTPTPLVGKQAHWRP